MTETGKIDPQRAQIYGPFDINPAEKSSVKASDVYGMLREMGINLPQEKSKEAFKMINNGGLSLDDLGDMAGTTDAFGNASYPISPIVFTRLFGGRINSVSELSKTLEYLKGIAGRRNATVEDICRNPEIIGDEFDKYDIGPEAYSLLSSEEEGLGIRFEGVDSPEELSMKKQQLGQLVREGALDLYTLSQLTGQRDTFNNFAMPMTLQCFQILFFGKIRGLEDLRRGIGFINKAAKSAGISPKEMCAKFKNCRSFTELNIDPKVFASIIDAASKNEIFTPEESENLGKAFQGMEIAREEKNQAAFDANRARALSLISKLYVKYISRKADAERSAIPLVKALMLCPLGARAFKQSCDPFMVMLNYVNLSNELKVKLVNAFINGGDITNNELTLFLTEAQAVMNIDDEKFKAAVTASAGITGRSTYYLFSTTMRMDNGVRVSYFVEKTRTADASKFASRSVSEAVFTDSKDFAYQYPLAAFNFSIGDISGNVVSNTLSVFSLNKLNKWIESFGTESRAYVHWPINEVEKSLLRALAAKLGGNNQALLERLAGQKSGIPEKDESIRVYVEQGEIGTLKELMASDELSAEERLLINRLYVSARSDNMAGQEDIDRVNDLISWMNQEKIEVITVEDLYRTDNRLPRYQDARYTEGMKVIRRFVNANADKGVVLDPFAAAKKPDNIFTRAYNRAYSMAVNSIKVSINPPQLKGLGNVPAWKLAQLKKLYMMERGIYESWKSSLASLGAELTAAGDDKARKVITARIDEAMNSMMMIDHDFMSWFMERYVKTGLVSKLGSGALTYVNVELLGQGNPDAFTDPVSGRRVYLKDIPGILSSAFENERVSEELRSSGWSMEMLGDVMRGRQESVTARQAFIAIISFMNISSTDDAEPVSESSLASKYTGMTAKALAGFNPVIDVGGQLKELEFQTSSNLSKMKIIMNNFSQDTNEINKDQVKGLSDQLNVDVEGYTAGRFIKMLNDVEKMFSDTETQLGKDLKEGRIKQDTYQRQMASLSKSKERFQAFKEEILNKIRKINGAFVGPLRALAARLGDDASLTVDDRHLGEPDVQMVVRATFALVNLQNDLQRFQLLMTTATKGGRVSVLDGELPTFGHNGTKVEERGAVGKAWDYVWHGLVGDWVTPVVKKGWRWEHTVPWYQDQFSDYFGASDSKPANAAISAWNMPVNPLSLRAMTTHLYFGAIMSVQIKNMLPWQVAKKMYEKGTGVCRFKLDKEGQLVLDEMGAPIIEKVGIDDVAEIGGQTAIAIFAFRNWAPMFYGSMGIWQDMHDGAYLSAWIKFNIANYFLMQSDKGFWDSTMGRTLTVDRYIFKLLSYPFPKTYKLSRMGLIGAGVEKFNDSEMGAAFASAMDTARGIEIKWGKRTIKLKVKPGTPIHFFFDSMSAMRMKAQEVAEDPKSTENERKSAELLMKSMDAEMEIFYKKLNPLYWEGRVAKSVWDHGRNWLNSRTAKKVLRVILPAGADNEALIRESVKRELEANIFPNNLTSSGVTMGMEGEKVTSLTGVASDTDGAKRLYGAFEKFKTKIGTTIKVRLNGAGATPLHVKAIHLDGIGAYSDHPVTYSVHRLAVGSPLSDYWVEIHISRRALDSALAQIPTKEGVEPNVWSEESPLWKEIEKAVGRAETEGVRFADNSRKPIEREEILRRLKEEAGITGPRAESIAESAVSVGINRETMDGVIRKFRATNGALSPQELIMGGIMDGLFKNAEGLTSYREVEAMKRVLAEAFYAVREVPGEKGKPKIELVPGTDYRVIEDPANNAVRRRRIQLTESGKNKLRAHVEGSCGKAAVATLDRMFEKFELVYEAYIFQKEVREAFESGEDPISKYDQKRLQAEAKILVERGMKNQGKASHTDRVRAATLWCTAHAMVYKDRGATPHDVQIMAGYLSSIGSRKGGVAINMDTGDGKTRVATLAGFLEICDGFKVLFTSITDTYARRDYYGEEGKGEAKAVYDALGVQSGFIDKNDNNKAGKYSRNDVNYEAFGTLHFDMLHDKTTANPAERFLPADLHNYWWIPDEADYTLFFTVNTPAVVITEVPGAPRQEDAPDKEWVDRADEIVKKWIDAETGKVKEGCGQYFTKLDAGAEEVELSEEGKVAIKAALKDPADYEMALPRVIAAVRAYAFYIGGKHYDVQEGLGEEKLQKLFGKKLAKSIGKKLGKAIILLDSGNHRRLYGQQLPEDLNKALCKKEGLRVVDGGLASLPVTVGETRNPFGGVSMLSGTNFPLAEYFAQEGILSVIVPPNVPHTRVDHPTIMCRSTQEQVRAVVKRTVLDMADGNPAMVQAGAEKGVGFISIERLSDEFKLVFEIARGERRGESNEEIIRRVAKQKGGAELIARMKKICGVEDIVSYMKNEYGEGFFKEPATLKVAEKVKLQELTGRHSYNEEVKIVDNMGNEYTLTLETTANRAVDAKLIQKLCDKLEEMGEKGKGMTLINVSMDVDSCNLLQVLGRVARTFFNKGKGKPDRAPGSTWSIFSMDDPYWSKVDPQAKACMDHLFNGKKYMIVADSLYPTGMKPEGTAEQESRFLGADVNGDEKAREVFDAVQKFYEKKSREENWQQHLNADAANQGDRSIKKIKNLIDNAGMFSFIETKVKGILADHGFGPDMPRNDRRVGSLIETLKRYGIELKAEEISNASYHEVLQKIQEKVSSEGVSSIADRFGVKNEKIIDERGGVWLLKECAHREIDSLFDHGLPFSEVRKHFMRSTGIEINIDGIDENTPSWMVRDAAHDATEAGFSEFKDSARRTHKVREWAEKQFTTLEQTMLVFARDHLAREQGKAAGEIDFDMILKIHLSDFIEQKFFRGMIADNRGFFARILGSLDVVERGGKRVKIYGRVGGIFRKRLARKVRGRATAGVGLEKGTREYYERHVGKAIQSGESIITLDIKGENGQFIPEIYILSDESSVKRLNDLLAKVGSERIVYMKPGVGCIYGNKYNGKNSALHGKGNYVFVYEESSSIPRNILGFVTSDGTIVVRMSRCEEIYGNLSDVAGPKTDMNPDLARLAQRLFAAYGGADKKEEIVEDIAKLVLWHEQSHNDPKVKLPDTYDNYGTPLDASYGGLMGHMRELLSDFGPKGPLAQIWSLHNKDPKRAERLFMLYLATAKSEAGTFGRSRATVFNMRYHFIKECLKEDGTVNWKKLKEVRSSVYESMLAHFDDLKTRLAGLTREDGDRFIDEKTRELTEDMEKNRLPEIKGPAGKPAEAPKEEVKEGEKAEFSKTNAPAATTVNPLPVRAAAEPASALGPSLFSRTMRTTGFMAGNTMVGAITGLGLGVVVNPAVDFLYTRKLPTLKEWGTNAGKSAIGWAEFEFQKSLAMVAGLAEKHAPTFVIAYGIAGSLTQAPAGREGEVLATGSTVLGGFVAGAKFAAPFAELVPPNYRLVREGITLAGGATGAILGERTLASVSANPVVRTGFEVIQPTASAIGYLSSPFVPSSWMDPETNSWRTFILKKGADWTALGLTSWGAKLVLPRLAPLAAGPFGVPVAVGTAAMTLSTGVAKVAKNHYDPAQVTLQRFISEGKNLEISRIFTASTVRGGKELAFEIAYTLRILGYFNDKEYFIKTYLNGDEKEWDRLMRALDEKNKAYFVTKGFTGFQNDLTYGPQTAVESVNNVSRRVGGRDVFIVPSDTEHSNDPLFKSRAAIAFQSILMDAYKRFVGDLKKEGVNIPVVPATHTYLVSDPSQPGGNRVVSDEAMLLTPKVAALLSKKAVAVLSSQRENMERGRLGISKAAEREVSERKRKEAATRSCMAVRG